MISRQFKRGVNREVTETAEKVMKKLKEEFEKKGLQMSVTEKWKEGKSKMIASCGSLEDELRQNSEDEGVTRVFRGGGGTSPPDICVADVASC